MTQYISLLAILLLFCLGCQPEKPVERVRNEPTPFAISTAADTTLFGPRGTRLFVRAESFQYADGTVVTEPVEIEMREFYDRSDIVLADLSTRAGDHRAHHD